MNPPTLPPKPSALPNGWVDRIFAELLMMYGKHWADMWAGCDIDTVKQSWAAALGTMDGETIRLAFDSLRKEGRPFPPTQPEFIALCQQNMRKGAHRLALVAPRTEAPADAFKTLRSLLEQANRRG